MGLTETLMVTVRFGLFCFAALTLLSSTAGESAVGEIRLPLDPTPEARTAANSNSIPAVCDEVLNPAALSAVAFAHGISLAAVKGIEVSRASNGTAVVVRKATGSTAEVFDVMTQELRWYVQERAEGHSAAFLFGCLTNRAWRLPHPAGDLKVLADRHPKLPTALLRKWESGTYTNRTGTPAETRWGKTYANGKFHAYTNTVIRPNDEVVSWTDYLLLDGELAWLYQARHPPLDGVLGPVIGDSRKIDAKEFDSKFRHLILRAENEARTELEGRGQTSPRQWRVDQLMKEKLKAQGIDWRSSADLYPGPRRDFRELLISE